MPEYSDQVRMDPEDFKPKKHTKLDKRARGEAQAFEDWAENTANEYAQPQHQDKELEKKDKEERDKVGTSNVIKKPRVKRSAY